MADKKRKPWSGSPNYTAPKTWTPASKTKAAKLSKEVEETLIEAAKLATKAKAIVEQKTSAVLLSKAISKALRGVSKSAKASPTKLVAEPEADEKKDEKKEGKMSITATLDVSGQVHIVLDLSALSDMFLNPTSQLGMSFRARLAHAISTLLAERFDKLAQGGTVGGVKWPRLAKRTLRRRARKGLGPLPLTGGILEDSMQVGKFVETKYGAKYTPPYRFTVLNTGDEMVIANDTTYGRHNPFVRTVLPVEFPKDWWTRIWKMILPGVKKDIAAGLKG